MFRACRNLKDDFVSKLLYQGWSFNMWNVNTFKIKTLVSREIWTCTVRFATHRVNLMLSCWIVVLSEFASIFLLLQIKINAELSISSLSPGINLTSKSQGESMLFTTCNFNDFASQTLNLYWNWLTMSVLVCNASVCFTFIKVFWRILSCRSFVYGNSELATCVATKSNKGAFSCQNNRMFFTTCNWSNSHFKRSRNRCHKLLGIKSFYEICLCHLLNCVFFCDF